MISSDIFNFEFVDRRLERDSVDKFLSDNETSNNVLWLSGRRGIGKSYFLTEHVMKKDSFANVYINGDSNNLTQGYFVKKVISQLNSICGMSFLRYLKNNYKSMITIGQKTLNIVLNFADLDDNGIVDLTSFLSNLFISKDDEEENIVTVLIKYTYYIEKKHGRVIFILDNFTDCDSYSFGLISEMIHKISSKNTIKFILCTTDEDMDKRPDLKSALVEKIPHVMIKMLPFQQKSLFSRMIERSFDLDDTQRTLLSLAFDICRGVPQNFKEILINLYTAQGIILGNDKAQIITEMFTDMLYKENISFNIDELCESNVHFRKLLQLIAWFGAPLRKDILISLFCFILDMNNHEFFYSEVNKLVYQLESRHILTLEYDNNMEMVKFRHDSLCISVRNYFKNDKFISFMQHKIYEFLMLKNGNEIRNADSYWNEYYEALCAYHSFSIRADGWIELNFEYGYGLFKNGLYEDAKSIFERLDIVLPLLSCKKLLTIGSTYFHCGEYDAASKILSRILEKDSTQDLSIEENIKTLIYLARAKSCLLECADALKFINLAEEISISDGILYVPVMAAKQSILFLTPNGFNKAKDIFNNIVQLETHIKEMALIYQSAMDYYEGEKSLYYLEKGLEIALEFEDVRTSGKILNNIGFELFRCGEYHKSEDFFNRSISTLSQCQPHEQAYPFNNLAILNMINHDYEKALDNISESLFWNKSEYLSLVLKTNRMLCYFFAGNSIWEELYTKLYEYIKSQKFVDDKIYKKICTNLAFISSKTDKPFKGIEILDMCRSHMQNEWENGRYRFNRLYSQLTGNTFSENCPPISYRSYYCEIEFEPWLINFSHD